MKISILISVWVHALVDVCATSCSLGANIELITFNNLDVHLIS